MSGLQEHEISVNQPEIPVDNTEPPNVPDNVEAVPESAISPGLTGGEPIEKGKVDLLLKAVGDAPIMKKKRWAVDPEKKVAWVSEFVRKYIKCESGESIFLYVNQYFSPAPDQEIGCLYECFGSDGKLVLHYCKQQAWG